MSGDAISYMIEIILTRLELPGGWWGGLDLPPPQFMSTDAHFE